MLILIILFIVPVILGAYAQLRVWSAYHKNIQIPSRGGITGREAAKAVMESAGINDVEIVPIEGQLSDHFDPTEKRLALSEDIYNGTSLAALGIAAHEAGHAIQQKVGYGMMTLRQNLAPATQIASGASMLLIIFGITIGAKSLGGIFLMLGALALAVICIFQLVTLPVEFDASNRAKAQLVSLGIVDADEMAGVHETLDAAALTYVAAFIASLASLLRLLLIITGGSRDD
jgi:uncharacterized protein